jgi:hypothetical protein
MKTTLQRFLPPYTLTFMLGALAVGVPLLLRTRGRTNQGSGITGLIPRLCEYP